MKSSYSKKSSRTFTKKNCLQESFENILSFYERFVLEPELGGNIFLGVLSAENDEEMKKLKNELKRNLITNILKIDRKTATSRINKAKALTNEILHVLSKILKADVLEVKASLCYKGLFGSSQGLGEGLLEVGLSWDPILDLPVIPGSSFKGAVRSFCYNLLVSKETDKKEAERLCSTIFGSAGEGDNSGFAGVVSFLDAIPVEAGKRNRILAADVLNPHYNAISNSYLRTELEVSPVPILHLCVNEGVTFEFIAYVPRRAEKVLDTKLIENLELLAEKLDLKVSSTITRKAILVTAFLVGGALRLGVGARTLKGYGRFKLEEVKVYAGA